MQTVPQRKPPSAQTERCCTNSPGVFESVRVMREKEKREREDLPQVGGLRSPDGQMQCGSLIQKGHPWEQRLNLSEACRSGRRGVHAESPQPQVTLQACEC